jgi:glutaminase
VCGREPTGDSSTLLTLNEDGLPFNPLNTAGGLNLVGLLRTELARRGSADDVLTRFRAVWGALAGGAAPAPAPDAAGGGGSSSSSSSSSSCPDGSLGPGVVRIDDRGSGGGALATVNAELVAQQKGPAANRLKSVGRYLRHLGCFPDRSSEGLPEALDAMLAMQAIDVTAESLATIAATLAHGGVCPLTQRRVLSAEAVKNTLSVMFTCGLGEESGDFSYACGVPAKTNKCGAIMIVVPGVFGCAFYSPEVNAAAQPLKGWAFARALSASMCVHRYCQSTAGTSLFDMKLYYGSSANTEVGNMLTAAQSGDLMELQHMHMGGTDLDAVDYDARSAAHLAAAGGSLTVLQYLHENGANLMAKDRWGITPLQDAQKLGALRCIEFLTKL